MNESKISLCYGENGIFKNFAPDFIEWMNRFILLFLLYDCIVWGSLTSNRGFVNFTLKTSAFQAGFVFYCLSAGLRPSVMKLLPCRQSLFEKMIYI
jgi:hypothetical protein